MKTKILLFSLLIISLFFTCAINNIIPITHNHIQLKNNYSETNKATNKQYAEKLLTLLGSLQVWSDFPLDKKDLSDALKILIPKEIIIDDEDTSEFDSNKITYIFSPPKNGDKYVFNQLDITYKVVYDDYTTTESKLINIYFHPNSKFQKNKLNFILIIGIIVFMLLTLMLIAIYYFKKRKKKKIQNREEPIK